MDAAADLHEATWFGVADERSPRCDGAALGWFPHCEESRFSVCWEKGVREFHHFHERGKRRRLVAILHSSGFAAKICGYVNQRRIKQPEYCLRSAVHLGSCAGGHGHRRARFWRETTQHCHSAP